MDINNCSLKEVFSKAVTAYSAEYKKGMSTVIVAMADSVLYLSDTVEKYLRKSSIRIEDIVKKSKEWCDQFGEGTIPAFFDDSGDITGSKRIKLLFLNNNSVKAENIIEVFKERYKADHEFGHLFADFNNEQDQHVSESIAEAHASIMHVKVFGKDTGFIDYEVYLTSTNALFSSINHYTVPAIDAVNLLKEMIDIENFSLSDIAELANEIAYEYHYDEEDLKDIVKAYEKVYEEYVPTEDVHKKEKFMKEIVRTMFENKNSEEIYRVGRLYFNLEETQRDVDLLKKKDFAFWESSFEKMSIIEKENSFEINAALAMDKKRGYSAIEEIVEVWESSKLEKANKPVNNNSLIL